MAILRIFAKKKELLNMGRLYTLCLSILLPETCEGNKLSSFTLLIITDHRALKRDLGFRCLGKSRDFL
jgi:hypothetical protein